MFLGNQGRWCGRAAKGLCVAAVVMGVNTHVAWAESGCASPSEILPARELFVQAADLIQSGRADPGGPWHFVELVREMLPLDATDKDVSDLILNWFKTFDVTQSLRPDSSVPASDDNPQRSVAPRAGPWASVIEPWLEKSVALRRAAGQAEDGTLALAFAPFKLMAIVNRQDVRDPRECASSAGEGRFVFVALSAPTDHPVAALPSASLNFTLIFEYDLPTAAPQAPKTAVEWARAWHALSGVDCGGEASCPAFGEALQSLTAQFSQRALFPGRPVGNSLAQVRTNDIITFPGELREFKLVEAADGKTALVPALAKLTPDFSLIDPAQDQALGQWAFDHKDEILAERHVLPNRFAGFNAPYPRSVKWKFPNTGNLPAADFENVRFLFSKNTCNGCHSFEHPRVQDVDGAYHLSPEGQISGFVKNVDLPRRQAESCKALALASCSDDTSFVRAGFAPAKIRVH